MNPTFSRRVRVSPASSSDEVATPSRRTSPEVGKSIAPARFSSVDFPHPLRPTNATNAPAGISSETPSTARTGKPSLRYSFVTLFRLTMEGISVSALRSAGPDAEFIASDTLDDQRDALAHADAHGAQRVTRFRDKQLIH